MEIKDLKKISDYEWEIPQRGEMRVPGRIFADKKLLEEMDEKVREQVTNVACLPGILKASLAMPDAHWGYGFCVIKGTKVLSNFGYHLSIEKYEKIWPKEFLKTLDFSQNNLTESEILKFFKIKPNNRIFQLTTKSGRKIAVTEDHPLYTPFGMILARELKVGEKVAISPFEGVPYQKPSSKVIVSEKEIKKTLLNLGRKPGEIGFEQNILALKKRGLLPLTYHHQKLPYILKIIGFVFGDGSMNFIGKKGDGILHFSAKNKEDLEEIRKDIKKIAYTPSPIHLQKRKNYINYSFYVNASSLVILFHTLGVPLGKKVFQPYRVPKWIFKCPLWQKRLFLASYFGAELTKPRSRKKTMFFCPVLTLHKAENLISNGKAFLKDISKLLKEFGVKTIYISKRKKHLNKRGEITFALDLVFSSKIESLINLWSKIGFEYNKKRAFKANLALQYFKYKQKILEEKERAVKFDIPVLLKMGLSYRKIALKLATDNPLTKRFIEDVCEKIKKGKKEISLQVPRTFPSFKEYSKKISEGLGESGVVWDEIVEIKEIPYKGFVYDFTVNHKDHNFIANNFVVSNCIGGVAAMDEKEGVICVGGVGFDAGCLAGDTKILHEFGYTKNFKDFEKSWPKESIKSANPTHTIKSTPIARFIKYKPWQKVFKVKTETGREIIATNDHPFYTEKGMIEIEKIREGEKIAVFPFEGVEFKEPPTKILVDEEKIKDTIFQIEKNFSQNRLNQILTNLKKRNLLPLKANSQKFPYLLKIMGYLLGDGTIYFINKKGKGIIWFYGKPEDLKKIREDVKKIGFTPSKIYLRKRKHKIKTFYGVVKFERVESSFKVSSTSFALLLISLGLPFGNKAEKNYKLPSFLFELPLWQKRLFLAAFFGAELSSPKVASDNDYNFRGPILSLNKHQGSIKSGREFLDQIKDLLEEFGVKSKRMKERDEYITKKKKISKRLRLFIFADAENLINLWGKIGYEYHQEKNYLANVALQYLRLKQKVLKERELIEEKAKILKKEGLIASQIYEKLKPRWANKRFIKRSIYEERKTKPRIAYKFLKFPQFLKEATKGLGRTGMVWEKIVLKEEIKFDDFVYDFTVLDENHNFFANNILVSNCGVRTLKTDLTLNEVKPKIQEIVDLMFKMIPAGIGSRGKLVLTEKEVEEVFLEGARWPIKKGFGGEEDLIFIEDGGRLEGANPNSVSQIARKREKGQLGTLGSGNHYAEVQYIDEIYDEEAAKRYGLFKNQILISIHCGSRALGHQIGTDYLKVLAEASRKYGIPIRERELVSAPIDSPEGKQYAGATFCALNYAYANRQVLSHLARESIQKIFPGANVKTFWDLTHNSARWENHLINGKIKRVLVHRKGSTRAFGPAREEIPEDYRDVGQPVIIGGTMGTYSFILRGTEFGMREAFGSACHGSGRAMSRTQARKRWWGKELIEELKKQGIYARTVSFSGFAEEAPGAYKDVAKVIDVVDKANLAKKVVRMKPLGVIKG